MKSLYKVSRLNHPARYIYAKISRDTVTNKYQGQNGPEWSTETQNDLAQKLKQRTQAELKKLESSLDQEKVLEIEVKRGDTAGALVLGLLGRKKFSYSLPVEYLSTRGHGKKHMILKDTGLFTGQVVKVRLEKGGPKVFVLDEGQALPESAADKAAREKKEAEQKKKAKQKAEAAAKKKTKKEDEPTNPPEPNNEVLPQIPSEQSPALPPPTAQKTPNEQVKQPETDLKNVVNAEQFVDMSYRNLSGPLKKQLDNLKKVFKYYKGSAEDLWNALEEKMDDDWYEEGDEELALDELLDVLSVQRSSLTDEQKNALISFMQTLETTAGEKVNQYIADRQKKINTDSYTMRIFGGSDPHERSKVPVVSQVLGLVRGAEKSVFGIVDFFTGLDLSSQPDKDISWGAPGVATLLNSVSKISTGIDWAALYEDNTKFHDYENRGFSLDKAKEFFAGIGALGSRLATVTEKEGLGSAAFDVFTAIGELFPPALLANKIRKVGVLQSAKNVGKTATALKDKVMRGGEEVRNMMQAGYGRYQQWRAGSTSGSLQDIGNRIRGWTNRSLRRTRRLENSLVHRTDLISEMKVKNIHSMPIKEIQKDINKMRKSFNEMQKQKNDIGNLQGPKQLEFKKQMFEIEDLIESFQREYRKKLLDEKPSGFKGLKEKWITGDLSATVGKRLKAYDYFLKFMNGRKGRFPKSTTQRLSDDITEFNDLIDDIQRYTRNNSRNISQELKMKLNNKSNELKVLRDEFNTVVNARKDATKHINEMKNFITNDLKKTNLDKMNKINLESKLKELEKKLKEFDQHIDFEHISETSKRQLIIRKDIMKRKQTYIEDLIQKRITHIDTIKEGLKNIQKGQKIEIGGNVFKVIKVEKNFKYDPSTGKFKGKLTVKHGSNSKIEWKMKKEFPDEVALEKITSIQ